MEKLCHLCLLLPILWLSSCHESSPTENVMVKPDSTSLGCSDYLSLQTDIGVFHNNVWNKQAAQGAYSKQCLEKRIVDGVVQFGWSWTWPSTDRAIYGYPQVKLGSSPWGPEPRNDSRFPLNISTLHSLSIAYDVETTTTGQHNLTTSMWLTNTGTISQTVDTSSIVAEFMIWTYSTANHFNPAGKKIGEFTDPDGREWEFWGDKNWGDVSGTYTNKWVNITYQAKASTLRAEFDALPLIQHAIAEKMLSPDWYVADIELGNEVMGGTGITWIKSFAVTIN